MEVKSWNEQRVEEQPSEKVGKAAQHFRAGQLKSHLPFWKRLTSDKISAADIEGVQLEFVENAMETLPRDCEPYYFEGSKRARIEPELEKNAHRMHHLQQREFSQKIMKGLFRLTGEAPSEHNVRRRLSARGRVSAGL